MATMALTSPLGGRLTEWFGLRSVVVSGGLLGAVGIALLARLASDASAVAVGGPLLLVGLGLGLSTGPSQAGALGAVDARQSGMAAAALAMLRYVGGIVGTVILGYSLAGRGAEALPRQYAALWIFAAAFLTSGVCGLGLSTADARREKAA